MQIGAGVDQKTWDYHRYAGHYSAWFRDCIKDADLATEAEQIERDAALDSAASRAALERAIVRRYNGARESMTGAARVTGPPAAHKSRPALSGPRGAAPASRIHVRSQKET